jgi:hypothetical protein
MRTSSHTLYIVSRDTGLSGSSNDGVSLKNNDGSNYDG